MARHLPEFAPLSLKELRSSWKKYRGNEDIERLVLEVQLGRGVINEIDGYFKSIHQVWRAENLGELAEIERVRLLLIQQSVRRSVLAGLKPAPKRDEPPEPEPALVE
jgi:hypothetical protein